MRLHPHITQRYNTVQFVMLDVLLALLPIMCIAWLAYGELALNIFATAVGAAIVTEFLFSGILLKRWRSVFDGSAIVTAILLACTLSPLTPWYVVAFGAFAAILFGKIVWGGLGKNRFNPALVGREFMAVFFSSIMLSPHIWTTNGLVQTATSTFFPMAADAYSEVYLQSLVYKTGGALGEYSIVALSLGGFYLLLRNRISWHIPLALLTVFIALFWLVPAAGGRQFSLAGVLLGTLFMATDMPSSPTTARGKVYYGGMIGLVAFLFILGNVRFEYMSYAILLLNGFSDRISYTFQPRVWGRSTDWKQQVEKIFVLTLSIFAVTLAVLSLYYYNLTAYVVYLYILYIIFKFNFSLHKKVNNPV
ncbi:RnfABCDGE type electron transport complex subunit D [Sphingobacterium oryzagri]|uniref:RnfABCDGE type electron transport complex subunit D n=1 Tax=Sphingobacterium oryzagri TaxID=3025669 RepID=A0ABY7WMW5_9SPHI|nr:RnfABCDGE type electron transport complex subunit D [Sphingobacterium sp. KACC 22765]WDF70017.1 RnfABCDGE type electron transport complex subunit D [Sphingobacterium sp. KACC 22765]